MKTGILLGLVVAFLLTSLLGCSNPRTDQASPPVSALPETPPTASSVPEFSIEIPLEPHGKQQPEAGPPTLCRLGQSCMALDPRPFEPCLLSTKHCKDKVKEPLLVDKPAEPVAPPAVIETSVASPTDPAR